MFFVLIKLKKSDFHFCKNFDMFFIVTKLKLLLWSGGRFK